MIALLFAAHLATADAQRISESLGHMIGKHLEELGLPLDLDALAKGLQEEGEGKSSPLEEEACLAQLEKLQKEQEIKKAEDQKALTEALLTEQKAKPGVISCLDGKLLYEVLQPGKGVPLASYNSPLIRRSQEGLSIEERICLSEASPMLQKGLSGMREGEVRKFYIHPDLNDAVIMTVELLQVDTPVFVE
jgi:peptidylprolyl isomerase